MRSGVGVVLGMLVAASAGAAPLPRGEVPEPLRPWIDWVLRGHQDQACASFYGDSARRQCAWPSRLTLTLDEHGGSFAQQWEMQRELWIDLPGDATHAPQDVMQDGTPAVLVVQGGVPRLRLERGRHRVRGRFVWDHLPEMLPIPLATGVVDLTLHDEAIAFPN